LLHDMMETRTYVQLKDLALDRTAENQRSRKSAMNLLETAEDQRRKHPLPIHTYTIYHLSVPNDW